MWRTCTVLVLVAELATGCSSNGDDGARAKPKAGKQVVVAKFEFEPTGVAVDGAGTVYTSGWDGKQFMILSVPRKGKPTRRPIPCATDAGNKSPRSGALAAKPDGTLYWSKYAQFRVVRLDPSGGGLCIAGTGTQGYSGDGGPATQAEIGGVNGLAIDPASHDLYITNQQNHTLIRDEREYSVRKVDRAGIITTAPDFGGESVGGPAAELAFDGRRGRRYVDSINGVISYKDGDGPPKAIPGKPGMPFIAIAVDPMGGDLVAIRGGNAYLDQCEVTRVSDRGEVRLLKGGNLLPDCAYSVAVDASGDIWMATERSRLIVFRPPR